MKFNKDVLKTKKAISLYVSLAVLIASAFGFQDIACNILEVIGMKDNACTVSQ